MRHYHSQLKTGSVSGAIIAAAGGLVYVTAAGGTAKATLTDVNGAALSNPLALTRGAIDFYTADSVASVDLYIQSPTGHFVMSKGVKPSGDSSIAVDISKLSTTFVIPVNVANQTADATETVCGFTIPAGAAVQPNVAVDVVAIDATETIDFGTLESASGDANGFGALVPIGVLGYIRASNATGVATVGAKLYVQDSANSGDKCPEQDVSQAGKQFSYTLSAGADTFAGFIVVPMQLRPSTL